MEPRCAKGQQKGITFHEPKKYHLGTMKNRVLFDYKLKPLHPLHLITNSLASMQVILTVTSQVRVSQSL